MCLTKVYHNTYSNGAQDVTEKAYPCRDGRSCSRAGVRHYDRKFPFGKLGDPGPELHRSLSERQPTPYFEPRSRRSKSPSPSSRRDSGVYMSGGSASKHYDYRDPYGNDAYGYQSPSRHDPRDRYGRDRERDRDREPRLKRSSTAPHIVYVDRDGPRSDKSSRSRSRSGSRDIPIGLVPLADEYGRRHRRHSTSSSRSRSREDRDKDGYYSSPSRRRTDDPSGYILHSDADERRHRRRRISTSDYPDPTPGLKRTLTDPYGTTGAGTSGRDAYTPRRASPVLHQQYGDGSGPSSTTTTPTTTPRPKQLRWEDQVRARRERQNAEIASRAPTFSSSASSSVPPLYPEAPKGILKRSDSSGGRGKGKGREVEDIEALRRSIERMEIPRGRDREPRGGRDEWRGRDDGWEYGYDGGRRKRSKVYADEGRYRY